MNQERPRVDVLVVDDRPEQLLAIEAVLEPLGENVITAISGREALRHVLKHPFALILIDINMPGMDGFETAEMIRAYRASAETPIIFLTAASEELHAGRSYALGAVDYILTPVVPEVLRSKVRVFADLYRKTVEVEHQRQGLAQEAARLRQLTEASLAINCVLTLDGILQATTDAARRVACAHQAVTTLDVPSAAPAPGSAPAKPPGTVRSAVSFSDKYVANRGRRSDPASRELYALACPSGGALLLTQREIEARPDLARAGLAAGEPPPRGLLAVPLTESDGQVIGLIQVSDKEAGDFTGGDLEGLIQLAQLGSIAVQNCQKAEAREANRLKDEFLAMLSHELRTPLNAILGWTRLLRDGAADPARVSRGLQVIERNVKVQAALIEDLLDVSRIAAGKLRLEKRRIDLTSVVEAALDAVRPAAEAKGVHLQASIDPDAGQVLGDGDRLQQVVGNLVGNAIKFTPAGGCVEVRVRRRGAEAEIVVADTGAGIAPELLPFVFDRFRQADDSTRSRTKAGLGLGLALVRHLVELHGGSVRGESPGPGHGATFTVRIPEMPAGAQAPVLREPSPPPAGGDVEPPPVSGVQTLDGLRVLVVDDNDDARELLREVLSQHRAQVTTASSTREALDAIAASKPHVIVSDIAMKGEDGYDLIRRVRGQEGAALPALALTAFARTEDRLRALDAGFQMHAAKPIEPTELIAAVASLASGAVTP